MTTRTALILVAGFVAGCGAAAIAPLVIPPANAQTTQRWETLCIERQARTGAAVAPAFGAAGSAAGQEGWEPFSAMYDRDMFSGVICFKRPAP